MNITLRTAVYMIVSGICLTIFTPLSVFAQRQHLVYFEGTNYELNVYKIYGKQPGKTLMILGGIQGDEAGGFLSADLYVEMSLSKGRLIVVPRANSYSILLKRRGVNVDMNRKFSGGGKQTYESEVVEILKKLIQESDCFLNLHDGSGFYSETWINNMRNPLRFGQSIIADTDRYQNPKTGAWLNLEEMANKVCMRINPLIPNSLHHFHFNNHRTNARDTMHKEQRKSATYYSLYKRGIPAFGIETSKSLPLMEKVLHHNLAVNAFMEILDIIPEFPPLFLDPPELKYVIVSVNNNMPVVVEDGKTLSINKGDTIMVSHIETNYARGVIADIIGYGTVNDIRKRIQIHKSTSMKIRKDHFKCGQINIVVDSKPKTQTYTTPNHENINSHPSDFLFFRVKINGKEEYYHNFARLHLIKGDKLEIVDVMSRTLHASDLKVNFKGFVGNPRENTGEDRGYVIRTDSDLQPKYSLEGQGRIYPVIVYYNQSIVGKLFIELSTPYMTYIIIEIDNKEKRCLSPGEQCFISYLNNFQIIDLKTNIPDNDGVQLFINSPNFSSVLTRPKTPIHWDSLYFDKRKQSQLFKIEIKRDLLLLGSVDIIVDNPKWSSQVRDNASTLYQPSLTNNRGK